ncbi:hypothetical protein M011DRAFT_469885 [Sporormia fimetaria CBS 119925]|uniref:FAR1 domain-containing protein n=1 Tax=Sporormia fimetaria CBS 119925 TaxID=1340428 RepID=A0A6A6V6P8_9PLEO|nr:hypothetical protein M011DRAFT_469885 [Sporormia fimetaria CBS 119925]
MRPVLHTPQRIEDGVSAYNPLTTSIQSTASQYPIFPTRVSSIGTPIAQALSDFNRTHSDTEANPPNNPTHIDPPPQPPPQATHYHGAVPPVPHASPRLSEPAQPLTHTLPPQSSQQNAHATFPMLPPPPSTYPTWSALYAAAQSHAATQGYALSINTTAKNRSRIKLACVCYGLPKNTHKLTPETRVRRNRVSHKTGCGMWVEGKKTEAGWVLRVGEGRHNHPGRPPEAWAGQRARTWGVKGGRMGVGGVTAAEEMENERGGDEQGVEKGGAVWKIVEREMLKGGGGQGRDRGVGRTVEVLKEELPGIQIFKRDVYNIRAQIKRARKAAGEGLEGSGEDGDERSPSNDSGLQRQSSNLRSVLPRFQQGPGEHEDENDGEDSVRLGGKNNTEIDPLLVAQCSDALEQVTRSEKTEVERLREEVEALRSALEERSREIEERDKVIEGLRVQLGSGAGLDSLSTFAS